jgi:hypothetical protein
VDLAGGALVTLGLVGLIVGALWIANVKRGR